MKIDANTFTIRPFEPTDTDYAAKVKILNQLLPNEPTSVKILKQKEKNKNLNHLRQYFIGEVEMDKSKRITKKTTLCMS